MEFASWISPEIKLYIIKEFQRLKSLESDKLEWQGQRLIVKLNYLINTEAVSKYLITVNLTTEQKKLYENLINMRDYLSLFFLILL